MNLVYRKASETDYNELTNIAITSKKNWGYTDEEMILWKDELTINSSYISNNIVYKILNGNILIGFYAIRFNSEFDCPELDHLWLLPDFQNKGFGKIIFKNIIKKIMTMNQSRFIVISDPNSNGFYEKMKGEVIEKKESKIKNRYLSIYQFDITRIISAL
ncbi:MAG TPA: GNAT family N-acetyltransferase [Ignavibacteria bacterium]|nr:GNAT family N-acetyltransferase [Ignavibacteria bacterium]